MKNELESICHSSKLFHLRLEWEMAQDGITSAVFCWFAHHLTKAVRLVWDMHLVCTSIFRDKAKLAESWNWKKNKLRKSASLIRAHPLQHIGYLSHTLTQVSIFLSNIIQCTTIQYLFVLIYAFVSNHITLSHWCQETSQCIQRMRLRIRVY